MVGCHPRRVLPSCPKQHGDRACWLPLDKEGNKEDLWAEAYACCLQRMAEASVGCSWETKGEGMIPQVSPLVQAFLTAMGRSVSPSMVRECWPSKNDNIPRQPTNPLQARITHCLDKAAMREPFYHVAWDMFAWPESNRSFLKEDCLPYSPGSTVDLSTRMPGVHLKLHDREGNYQGVARVLKYEGHMLVYDPQTNGAGWVAMKGIPTSLTEVEARSAEDLGGFGKLLSCPARNTRRSTSHPATLRGSYCRLLTTEMRKCQNQWRETWRQT